MRTVRRAADGLPGSYFIVLPLTHPESRFCGNERGAELRDTLQSGLCVGKVDGNAFVCVLRVKVQRSKVAPGLHGLPSRYDFSYLLFITFAKENKRIGVGLLPGSLFKGIQCKF